MTADVAEVSSDATIVFGMSSTRTDDDLLEEVKDALDAFKPDGWTLVSWRRSAGTRFIVRGPVACRLVADDQHLQLRSKRMSRMYSDMTDGRNEWLEPSGSAVGTDALKTVREWISAQWDSECEQLPEPEDSPKETAPAVRRWPRRVVVTPVKETPAPPKSTVSTLPKPKQADEESTKAVLEAFGLTGEETDSDGNYLGLFTFDASSNNSGLGGDPAQAPDGSGE